MTREEALTKAHEHVTAVQAERNSRGYPIHPLTAEQKIDLTLKTARFLLGEVE